MKKFILTAAVAVLVLPGIAAAAAFQPKILLLNEQCSGSIAYFPTALQTLGLAFTETNNREDFHTALTDGTEWDLVLVDEYDSNLSSLTLDAIAAYIADGGRCVLSYWDLDVTLAGAFGADIFNAISYTTPTPVVRWDAANPIFTTPNAISDADLVPIANTCDVDGFLLQPGPDAVAPGGYTAAPTDGQAAIIMDKDARTILLGITPGLFGPTMAKFLENCVTFVAPPTPPLFLTLSSSTPAVGSAFTVDVDVLPLAQLFDAWGVILGPNNAVFSFSLANPAVLLSGAVPLARNVPGLPAAFTGRLLNIAAIPPGTQGNYTIIVELVSAGVPLIPIDGYVALENVTVQ